MNNTTKYIVISILSLVGIAIILMLAAFIYSLFANQLQWNFEAFKLAFTKKEYWIFVSVIAAGGVVALLMNHKTDYSKDAIKNADGENSRLLTDKDLKKSKDYVVTNWSKLSKVEDGIVLRAEQKGNNIDIVMAKKPIHTLVVGTTGSGKTTGFINPTIQVLSNTKTKPSMIISDPKGELFDSHSQKLQENGYKILVIDLRKPYESSKWNPFEILRERIDNIRDLYYIDLSEGPQTVNGQVFNNDEEVSVRIQELKDEVYENAKDLTEAICPLEKSNDVTWQKGARGLINGIVLAFCEDYLADEMGEDQFCLANLYHVVSHYATGDCNELKEYLYGRSTTSKVRGLANTVLETSDKTLSSYLSDVSQFVEWLTDNGILSMTSSNDLDIYSLDETPTALFIQVPDERQTRHRLVTLLITQIYKSLVEKASRNKHSGRTTDFELLRNVYFLLDEFGNLPKFSNLESMITVGRSRKLFFELIVQSYEQLASKYGKEIANIVKSNCNIKIFLGTDDSGTIREVSELCGKKIVASTSVSSQFDKNSYSSSTGAKEIPLVYPNELAHLNNMDDFGNAYVLMFGHFPMKTKFTPSFKVKQYNLSKEGIKLNKKPHLFKEEEILYDIHAILERKKAVQKDGEEMKRLALEEEDYIDEQQFIKQNRINIFNNVMKANKKVVALKGLITDEEIQRYSILTEGDKIEYIDSLIKKYTDNHSLQMKLTEIYWILKNCKEQRLEFEKR